MSPAAPPHAIDAQETIAAIAALCGAGEAALVIISLSEGLSWCVSSADTARRAARTVAAGQDPVPLAVAVVAADGTLTEYAVAPLPGGG
jgi:hypothetical protein